jgi:hypothetical protein
MTVRELHQAAMRKAAAGHRMAEQGQHGAARCWWRYAARQEEMAFAQLVSDTTNEPTRCILGLSAASLWWQARKWTRAISVICRALPTASPFEHRQLVELMRRCEVEMRTC